MIPQHTGSTPDNPRTWGAADFESCQDLAAVQQIDELPDASAQRDLARCAGLWAAATTFRLAQRAQQDQNRRQRSLLRARRLHSHRLAA